MQLRPRPHHYVQWLAATLAAVLTTVGLSAAHAHPATAGMIFLVVVVVTATQAGLFISLYSAVLCALAFDYFFLPPFRTFILAGPQEWVSMVTFAISSLVAGRVSERARKQKDEAEQRREDVERLFQISQEMILHQDAASLIRDLPHLLKRIFSLEDVALYVQDRDQFESTSEEPAGMFKANLRDLAKSSTQIAAAVRDNFESHLLFVGVRPVGALAWSPPTLSKEVATAVSAQIGIALSRAMAIEASARLEASRESERLRAALIDSLTHELRTPLTAIRAAATTLTQDQGLDDPVRKELATVVDEESARLDALIGEAVEMAEIDANVVKVQAAPRHTRTLLEQVVAESRASLGRHQAVLMVQEPDRPVWFDARLLGRVFRHLIENAARYSPPESRIVLRARRVEGRLEFEVEDNGPGIDRADLPHIFEKFYRGKKGKVIGKGTGMGLAIARAIVRAHGGDLGVESSPEHGSTFRFWVPLVEKDPAESAS
ncbi:sensor histidine kinase [Occallatibacter savannae]|uniref:sensor histidine kinase n=1 Tax=Occallatibacter savannae TaxID=1002691 RepID=UPI000D69BBBE|nr:ATP-binding protein [Occallatibacter savannae]